MPDETHNANAVNEVSELLKAKQEEDALAAIDINVPVAPWLADQNAALIIRNHRLQIDNEIEPAMKTSRKRHNEPALQALGAQKAEIEERMRILLLAHPGARGVLASWAKTEAPTEEDYQK